MSILAGISGKEAVRKFQKIGYRIIRQRGSHVRLIHSGGREPLTIPLHHELKIGLLAHQIKLAKLTVQEFLDL